MARTQLALQTAFVSTASAGSAMAVDGANGNSFGAARNVFVYITNTGANAITAVLNLNTGVQGVTYNFWTAVVPSAALGLYWAMPQTIATQSDGNIYMDWSGGAATAKTMITPFYLPLTGL